MLRNSSLCQRTNCRGQTAANHKRIFCCIDYHEFITYSRITIASCIIILVKVKHKIINGSVGATYVLVVRQLRYSKNVSE